MWVKGFGGTSFETCAIRAVKNRECRSECLFQEMRRRVLLKIDRQDFIIVNLNLGAAPDTRFMGGELNEHAN